MECPNCGNIKLQKKGKRDGKQRYKCMSCGAFFTEGKGYIPIQKYSPLKGIICPECESGKVVRDGKLEDGTQRYKCRECGLRFSHKTLNTYKKKISWKCPYCGGALIYSGYSKKGNVCYACKECKKSCTADETGKPIKTDIPFNLTNREVRCPYCDTFNIKRAGYTKHGHQSYVCRECGHSFYKDSKTVSIEEIIKSILNGKNVEKAALEYKYTVEYLKKIMVPYYKKEKITQEQEDLIIKYGFHLNVPVDYLAEYIKCSEHKCKEVLKRVKKEFKEVFKSTNPGATLQSSSKIL